MAKGREKFKVERQKQKLKLLLNVSSFKELNLYYVNIYIDIIIFYLKFTKV